MRTSLLRCLVPLAGALAAAGCGNMAGSRFVKSESIEAARGGTIVVTEKDSPALAGTRLEIPPGALAADTRITLELGLEDLVAKDDVAGPVAVWGPAGTRFSTKARMSLPLTITADPGELSVQVREADGREFELPPSAVAVVNGLINFDVDGFTRFQPRRRSRCPQDVLVCHDGTTLRRTGPTCSFQTSCPTPIPDGGQVCPARPCPAACPNGFLPEPMTGCPTCQCRPSPSTDAGVAPCYRGGCSGQLCTDQPDAPSTCEWRPEYACYQQATCERQPDGQCGFTPTESLDRCLSQFRTDGGSSCPNVACTLYCQLGFERDPMTGCEVCRCRQAPDPAVDGGSRCSPPVCTLACQYGFERDPMTGCEVCRCRQAPDPAEDGGSIACPADAFVCPDGTVVGRSGPNCEFVCPPLPAIDAGAAPCYRGGCSGQLCTDQPNTPSTCEWRPEYACYQQAACERQPNGQCGHTPSPALTACLAQAADGGRP